MFGNPITNYALAILTALLLTASIGLKIAGDRIDTLTRQVATYAAAENTYKLTIQKSNASIETFLAEAKKRQVDSANAQEVIKPQVIKYETRAIKILTAKPSGPDTCVSTEKLFNDYLSGRTQ